MNYSNVLFLINNEIRAIKVSYEDGGKKDTIKKTFDQSVKKDDYVVVETGTRWNMTVCKVVETDVEVDLDSDEQLGWIVAKVDMAEFDKMKEYERAAVDHIKDAERLKKRRELQESLGLLQSEKLQKLPVFTLGHKDEPGDKPAPETPASDNA